MTKMCRVLLNALIALMAIGPVVTDEASAATKSGALKKFTETVGGMRFSLMLPANFSLIAHKTKELGTPERKMDYVVFGVPGTNTEPRIVIGVSNGFGNLSLSKSNLDACVGATMEPCSHAFSDYKQSQISSVELDGKLFGAVDWEGRNAEFGSNQVHACTYLTVSGGRMFKFEAYDPGVKPTQMAALHKAAKSIDFE